MHHIIRLPIQLTILLIIGSTTTAAAQPVTDAFECSRVMNSLLHIVKDTAHHHFTTTCYTKYNNAQTDTLYYDYKVSNGRLHITGSDSSEIIQNQYYNLKINHRSKKAVLSIVKDPSGYLLQANLLSREFYQKLVTGMSITDTGSFKKLSWHFKAASPYRRYDIVYDPGTSRINTIQYCYGNGAPFTVTIVFSYQTSGCSDSEFSLDPFCSCSNGQFVMTTPYANYTLTNTVNQ